MTSTRKLSVDSVSDPLLFLVVSIARCWSGLGNLPRRVSQRLAASNSCSMICFDRTGSGARSSGEDGVAYALEPILVPSRIVHARERCSSRPPSSSFKPRFEPRRAGLRLQVCGTRASLPLHDIYRVIDCAGQYGEKDIAADAGRARRRHGGRPPHNYIRNRCAAITFAVAATLSDASHQFSHLRAYVVTIVPPQLPHVLRAAHFDRVSQEEGAIRGPAVGFAPIHTRARAETPVGTRVNAPTDIFQFGYGGASNGGVRER